MTNRGNELIHFAKINLLPEQLAMKTAASAVVSPAGAFTVVW
jgi:hypothetical protein